MDIKCNNRALLHAYKKHGVTKNMIFDALSKGIRSKVYDKANCSIILFTENMAIVTDLNNNLLSAFKYTKRYYKNKTTKDILLKNE